MYAAEVPAYGRVRTGKRSLPVPLDGGRHLHLQIISQGIVPVPPVQLSNKKKKIHRHPSAYAKTGRRAAPVWSGHPMPDTEIQNNS